MLVSDKTGPLAHVVYHSLLSDLFSHRWQCGDRLIEAVIARDLNVSRTPVRQALARLENDGLAVSALPTGYNVVAPAIEDIRDIFEIRKALDPVAFAGVVQRAVPADDAELRRLHADIQGADCPSSFAAANVAYRRFWTSRIQNLRLADALHRFHMQVHLVRAATLHSKDGRRIARAGVARLSDAFLARDAPAAHHAMRDFVHAALVLFERAHEQSPP
ncbi:GntR family transcriptional regulator [Albirhodobacter sp. R86504]|uniref:GntR family transcriptional regulator n=1 Tax=Albirhodobacter sp. R86504 TaxID=3093848 RepID=UPI00367210EE